MLRSFFLLLAGLLTVTAPAIGQTQAPTAYFPLEMGNSWTYFYTIEPPLACPWTRFWVGPFSVESTLDIGEQQYTLFNEKPLFPDDSVRVDDAGRVFAHQHGTDVLMFDFTAPSDSTYTYTTVYQDTYDVTVRHAPLVETLVGDFSNCITFEFILPGTVDANYFYDFCPEVGLVKYIDGMGTAHALLRATINGAKVTAIATEESPGRAISVGRQLPQPIPGSDHVHVPYSPGRRSLPPTLHLAGPALPLQ